MSAYHVGADHINALVSYAKHIRFNPSYMFPCGQSIMNWAEIGQMLSTENDKSVNYRYKERNVTPYQWGEDLYFVTRYDALDVIKMIGSYEYQSCEHPEWKESLAKKFCTLLQDQAVSKIPGYEAATRDYSKPVGEPKIVALF
jgi:hypothetical protein